jgi:hypothetical protein
VSDFSADWLALREPYDHAARSSALALRVIRAHRATPTPRILDLACGTGSNMRYLQRVASSDGHAAATIRWRLVDRDPVLLAQLPRDPRVEVCQADLARLDRQLFAACSIATASALVDLVSERWLRTVAGYCADANIDVLFALTYDGRILCEPLAEDDELVRDLVNRHQRTDKGFGPALGPSGTGVAAECLAAHGYAVEQAASDWRLAPDARALQGELIDGWARAAAEMSPADRDRIERWRLGRMAHVEAGRSTVVVGHQDLAAVSPARAYSCGVRL